MSMFWNVVAAIVLGVAANLLTPYLKGGFLRGFTGMRRMRAEYLEIRIADAHFYNKHPTWLVLHLLKEVIYFLILSIFAGCVIVFLIKFNLKTWVYPVIVAVLTHVLTTLLIALAEYRHAKYPALYEAQARKKIAKLTGQQSAALNRSDSD